MRNLSMMLAVIGLLAVVGPAAHAGGKISIDDTKWISLGLGLRTSFAATQDGAPSGSDWSNDFVLNNMRLYVNGQVHKYLKFEVNTDCVFCGNASLGRYAVLDAIAKIELNPYFNIWAGRLIVPADRMELNGPFYSSTFDPYKTPFFSSDFSTNFGSGGAGVYARDQGVNIWGAAGPDGALQYVVGVFQGLQSSSGTGPNQSDKPLVAGRVAYNFLEVEKNPGYYTSGTYYGTAGNILTLGAVVQYQKDGAGSFANPGDFLGFATDLLFEMPFEDAGVLTFNGEFKYFKSDYPTAAFGDADSFSMFDGVSFTVIGLYMFDPVIGIGKFQPYFRYTGVYPDTSTDRDEIEAGVNYIIDGHNANVALFYQYGDIATKGLNYAPGAAGSKVSAIKLAIQLQI